MSVNKRSGLSATEGDAPVIKSPLKLSLRSTSVSERGWSTTERGQFSLEKHEGPAVAHTSSFSRPTSSIVDLQVTACLKTLICNLTELTVFNLFLNFPLSTDNTHYPLPFETVCYLT